MIVVWEYDRSLVRFFTSADGLAEELLRGP